MPQTVLRFPLCKIEIVTGCSLSHTHIHTLTALSCVPLSSWRPPSTHMLGHLGELRCKEMISTQVWCDEEEVCMNNILAPVQRPEIIVE